MLASVATVGIPIPVILSEAKDLARLVPFLRGPSLRSGCWRAVPVPCGVVEPAMLVVVTAFAPKTSDECYASALEFLLGTQMPFLVGGGFAMRSTVMWGG